ncbi:hypothetical protein [Calothrix rhizosoleniae]|uniref:hypothetical protein n=1 Tax=Calothrix rhizosoleniae TaxID=888997 RepID=UPI000B4989D1|nr:hypothetical protein [Calothrix rhizosoleniae]
MSIYLNGFKIELSASEFTVYCQRAKKQTLAEAAQEIQQLLTQLEASNPTATEIQKVEFVKAAIAPTRKDRFASALNAGWKEAIKELLDNKFLNVAIAVLEGWKNAGG